MDNREIKNRVNWAEYLVNLTNSNLLKSYQSKIIENSDLLKSPNFLRLATLANSDLSETKLY